MMRVGIVSRMFGLAVRTLCAGVSLSLLPADPAADAAGAELPDISLPPGFAIDVYAANVPDARSLTLGDEGTAYVASRRTGRIIALVPREGMAAEVLVVASGLNSPNGVAYRDGDLYVAETSRLLRFPKVAGHRQPSSRPQVIDDTLPSETHHGRRYIAFGPDGKLYLTIGAPCNVCDRKGFGLIRRYDIDSGTVELVARGVRNSVGMAWHPVTRELWFTDNGRDLLGDDLPPGELNRVAALGAHYGFPYCHGGEIPDPEFGAGHCCDEFVAPAQRLGPHVAPLGLTFYDGTMFPEEYRGQIFIAEHGSWNRSTKIGYRITLVRLRNGDPVSYEVFADGWLHGDDVSGRPVDLLVMPDGAMLVSDDHAGRVYRIRYTTPTGTGVGP